MAGEIVLTIEQILNLCEFVGVAVNVEKSVFGGKDNEDELETEYAVAQNEHGAVSWLYEYPEEGVYPLSGKPNCLK